MFLPLDLCAGATRENDGLDKRSIAALSAVGSGHLNIDRCEAFAAICQREGFFPSVIAAHHVNFFEDVL
jgi:hypothetical protein